MLHTEAAEIKKKYFKFAVYVCKLSCVLPASAVAGMSASNKLYSNNNGKWRPVRSCSTETKLKRNILLEKISGF